MSVEPGKTTLMETETMNQSCEGKNVCNAELQTTMKEDGKDDSFEKSSKLKTSQITVLHHIKETILYVQHCHKAVFLIDLQHYLFNRTTSEYCHCLSELCCKLNFPQWDNKELS